MTLELALRLGLIACAIQLCLTYGVHLLLTLSSWYESAQRGRERGAVDFETIAGSRFAPGVSILLPAFDEASTIVRSTHAALALDYPTFEVIVVNDGSRDETLAALAQAFALVPVDRATRTELETEPVEAFYESPTHPRLVVLDKRNGGKADALNAGLNAARHPYVCGVDADTALAQDALLRAMRLCIAEPHEVVGVTSYVDIARDPHRLLSTPSGRRVVELRPLLVAFQALDFLRVFFGNRLASSRNRFMMCATGTFQLWRRDLVARSGGWSRAFSCEDIELTFRLHERLRREREPYRIVCLPDRVAATEGPDTVAKLIAQRERWQRVTLETWWAYRRMFLRPRYGRVGLVGMPLYLLIEVSAPVFETASLVILAIALAKGLVGWKILVWTAALIAAVNATLNAGVVAADDRLSRSYSLRSLLALSLLAPLELLVYRPILSWARLLGTARFLRGDKGWHKFARNRVEVTA
ncbi:MAG: glycosyltransferase family 2 protein [Gaiellales bacterium]